MNLVVITRDSASLTEYLTRHTTHSVLGQYDSLNGMVVDELKNKIRSIDKLVYIHVTDQDNSIQNAVYHLSNLFRPKTFLTATDLVVVYKQAESLDGAYTDLFGELERTLQHYKSADIAQSVPNLVVNPVDSLNYDNIKNAIEGKNTYDTITPEKKLTYKISNSNKSSKSFEPDVDSYTNATPQNLNNKKMIQYESSKGVAVASSASEEDIIKPFTVTRKPTSVNLETIDVNPERVRFWVFSGQPMSGSTTHTTAFVCSALKAGRKVLVVDLSEKMDMPEFLDVATIKSKTLTPIEFLGNSISTMADQCVVYADNRVDIVFSIINYIQNNANLFNRTDIVVSCSWVSYEHIKMLLRSDNTVFTISSLMFKGQKSFLEGLEDGADIRSIVWFNDNIESSVRRHKFQLPVLKEMVKQKNFLSADPILFKNFEVDKGIYETFRSVTFDGGVS